VRNVEADPARVVRVNTLAAMHLLDWVAPGERVFFASTSEVYAGGVEAGIVAVPTGEDIPVMISDITAPRFAYAVSKLLGEAAFLHTARAKGFDAVVGRFHNVYGPRMGADHVIPEMSLRAGGEDPFRVPGADQFRAFCHVDDAVEAMVRLMAALLHRSGAPSARGRFWEGKRPGKVSVRVRRGCDGYRSAATRAVTSAKSGSCRRTRLNRSRAAERLPARSSRSPSAYQSRRW